MCKAISLLHNALTWDRLGKKVPCLLNLMPSGKYLMEDFYYAGGLPVIIKELGPLALVKNGDMIELDVEKRKLVLDVSEAELAKRRKLWKPLPAHVTRGYVKLYCETVNQADKGVDLEFLVGGSGAPVPRESH